MSKTLRLFRRVVVWDEAEQRDIALLTFDQQSETGRTIAAIYKARWQIALLLEATGQIYQAFSLWADHRAR